MADVVALTKKYFEVWNAHDVEGIQARALFLSLSPSISLSLSLSLARSPSLSLSMSLSVSLSLWLALALAFARALSLSPSIALSRCSSLSPPRAPSLYRAFPRSRPLWLSLALRSLALFLALPRSLALSRSLSLSRARLALSVLARVPSSRPLLILARSLPLLALSLGAFSPRSLPRPLSLLPLSPSLSPSPCATVAAACRPVRLAVGSARAHSAVLVLLGRRCTHPRPSSRIGMPSTGRRTRTSQRA
jgi:hypothetical protein